MSDTYIPIGGNSYFQHFDVLDDTNYELYFAIRSAFNYLVVGEGLVTDSAYTPILEALDLAMKTESNIKGATQIEEVLPMLYSLRLVSGVDDKYSHLFYLLNSLKNLGYLSVSADRITTLSNLKGDIVYNSDTIANKWLTFTFYSGELKNSSTITMLELLNLKAGNNYVPADLIPLYIDGLDTSVPIEKVLTYNLFNYMIS